MQIVLKCHFILGTEPESLQWKQMGQLQGRDGWTVVEGGVCVGQPRGHQWGVGKYWLLVAKAQSREATPEPAESSEAASLMGALRLC